MRHSVSEGAATPCITPTVKYRGVSVMALGAFENCKIGGFHQVKGKLNKIDYYSILQHHAISSSGTQFVSRKGFVLMQNNELKQTIKFCQRFIKSKDEEHVIQLMLWSVQSADLNPIKLVWDGTKQPTNAAHFWQILLESWVELSSVYLQCLMERMAWICEGVIAANGGHFELSKFQEFCFILFFRLISIYYDSGRIVLVSLKITPLRWEIKKRFRVAKYFSLIVYIQTISTLSVCWYLYFSAFTENIWGVSSWSSG